MTWFWRVLPFVGKAIHALEVRHRDELIVQLRADVDYWKTRAERLMDAALSRANAIHEPTMVDRKAPITPAGALGAITSALSITEIDSSKARKVAS